MSHTVHPYAHRLGILRDWRSRWFVGGSKSGTFRDLLRGDILVRQFLDKALRAFLVDDVEITRGTNSMHIIIKTARPGLIIGRSGEGQAKLKDDLLKSMRRQKVSVPVGLRLVIEEVRSPESHAGIVAHMIEELIEKRTSFRRVLKQTVEKVMANKDVKGVKVTLSGPLDNADMGRTESIRRGRLPLQTLRADVDFAQGRADMPYGAIGIKVWIYRGDIFEKHGDARTKKS